MPKKKKKYSKKKVYNTDKVFLFGSLMFAFVIILWVAVSLTQVDKKIIKELKKIAIDTGSKVEIVSSDTEEGKQFENMSGIGAILRFRV